MATGAADDGVTAPQSRLADAGARRLAMSATPLVPMGAAVAGAMSEPY